MVVTRAASPLGRKAARFSPRFLTPLALLAVLLLPALPASAGYDTNMAASFAIGQANLTNNQPNAYTVQVGSVGFYNPYSVAVSTTLGKTFVVDNMNNRVLIYNSTMPLHGQSADLVLGHPNFFNNAVNDNGSNISGAVSASNMAYPRGVFTDETRLFVADANNHRVLIWNTIPTSNGQAADLVLGPSSLDTNPAGPTQVRLRYPTNVFVCGSTIAVTEAETNRTMIWKNIPTSNAAPADLVLGQQDFTSGNPNSPAPSAQTMSWPWGVWLDSTKVIVADRANNRVLIWNTFPDVNGKAADVVVGHPQFDYTARLDNGSNVQGSIGAKTLDGPRGVFYDGTKLYVGDAGSSRVLIYNSLPGANFASADLVVGQQDLITAQDPWGDDRRTWGPYSVIVASGALIVSAASSNEVITFDPVPTSDFPQATRAIGHVGADAEFLSTIINGGPFAIGVNSPWHPSISGGKLFVAEFGNDRVQIFDPVPSVGFSSASVVVGQKDMRSNLHAASSPGALRLNGPYGAFYDGRKLFIADKSNNRVLGWDPAPTANFQAANFVLGHADFDTTFPDATSAAALYQPSDVFSDGKKFFVADSGSNRVLIFNSAPAATNQSADVVVGHPQFSYSAARDNGSNVSGSPSASNLWNPQSLFTDGEKFFVADRDNNRVLIWNSVPTLNFAAADAAVGQPDLNSNASNNGGISAATLYNPSGVFSDGRSLYVADYANNRVLVWHTIPAVSGVNADFVLGQAAFNANASVCSATGLSGATGVTKDGVNLYISDNCHRIKVYQSTTPAADLLWLAVSTPVIPSSTLTQGTTAAFLRVDAYSGGNTVIMDSIKVWRSTNIPDSSLGFRVYQDDENNGGGSYNPNVSFDPALDTFLGQANFVSSAAIMTTDRSVSGSTYTLWLALTLYEMPFAQADRPRIELRVNQNYTSFPLKGSPLKELGRIGSPVSVYSSTAIVADVGDIAYVSSATSNSTPPQAAINANNYQMATLKLRTVSDIAYLRQLKVYKEGTIDNADPAVTLYLDSNANGGFDSGTDAAISGQEVFVAPGTATITLSSLQQLSLTTATIFVVADFQNNESAIGRTFGVRFDADSFVFDVGSPDTMASTNLPYSSPLTSIVSAVATAQISRSTGVLENGATYYFRGNFGVQNVSKYRVVWDQNPTHVWTETETLWTTGLSTQTAGSGDWYFHAKAYNSGDIAGTTQDLGPFKLDNDLPTASDFKVLSSTGGWLGESQWHDLTIGATVAIRSQDLLAGMMVSTQAGPGGFGVMYSTTAGQSWITEGMSVSYDGNKEFIYSLAVYNGKLYAGQGSGGGNGDVLVFDGTSWSVSYDGSQENISALAVYNGKLYAGQGYNPGDGDVLVFDGSSWTGSYDGDSRSIMALAAYNGKLYAGQGTDGGTGDVLVFDGSSWSTSYNGGWDLIFALAVYNGKLYAGQGSSGGSGDVLAFDGSSWNTSYDGNQGQIQSLAVFNGKLYAGQGWAAGAGDVLVFDGSSWTKSYEGSEGEIASLAVYNGKLYAGQGYLAGDGDMLAFDGSSWNNAYDGSQEYIWSLAAYNGKLFAGHGSGTGDGDVLAFLPASSSTLTGIEGSVDVETMTSTGLYFVNSTNSVTCNGVYPCGATNQVVFTVSDMVGNIRKYGPFAVLVQNLVSVAISTPAFPGQPVTSLEPTGFVNKQPNFLWKGPSTTTVASLGSAASYYLQVSVIDPDFNQANIVVSITTPAVVQNQGVPYPDV
ncbi:MAG: hypothetical protein WC943_11995, partial [Elusimicrobiota bacterium]